MKVYIYTLSDPNTGEVRYVGKTLNLDRRFSDHLREHGNTHKERWFKSVCRSGISPVMEVIEEIVSENELDWQEAERFWIESLRFIGCRLTNSDSGGIGGKIASVETRKKQSDAKKGYQWSEQVIQKRRQFWNDPLRGGVLKETYRQSRLGSKSTPEQIAKMAASLTGRHHTEETKNKIRLALKGKPFSEVRKIAMKGIKRSPKAVANIKAAAEGRTFSREHIERVAKMNRGRKATMIERQKISAGLKAAWAKRKVSAVLILFGWTVLLKGQTHVAFDLNAPQFNAVPASNRWVTLQALTPFQGNLNNYTSSASGLFVASNLYVGDYAGVINQKGPASRITFQITVTATNLGVVAAQTITSVPGVQTYPTAGRSAWSIQADDNRALTLSNSLYAAQSTNISPAALTNFETRQLTFFNGVTLNNTNTGFYLTLGSSNLAFSNLGGNSTILWAAGVPVGIIGPAAVGVSTNLIVGGVITGNGNGITNLPVSGLASGVLLRTNDFGTNETFIGNTRIGSGSIITNGVLRGPLILKAADDSATYTFTPSFSGFGVLTINGGTADVVLSDGEITAARFIGPAVTVGFNGNGGGLSNAVGIISGNGVDVTTNANNRSFTLAVSGGVTNQWLSDSTNAAYGVIPLTAVLTNEARAVAITNTGNLLGGALGAPNGSVGSPSIRFLNDADTGFYSSGSGGTMSASINGVAAWDFGDGAGSRVFRPVTDNAYDIGETAKRVANVYAAQVLAGNSIASLGHYGNGLGLSNTVNILAGTGINVVTGVNLRSFTIIATNFIAEVNFQSNVYNFYTNYFNEIYVTNNATFNGKVTLNSNVFINMLSFPTNAWAGPTNTLTLGAPNKQFFIASTDCNITNVGGQIAGQNTWATLTVSNSTAGDITVRSTAVGLRAQGAATTAALVIGAGKEGFLSYESRDIRSTNYVTTTQSN